MLGAAAVRDDAFLLLIFFFYFLQCPKQSNLKFGQEVTESQGMEPDWELESLKKPTLQM